MAITSITAQVAWLADATAECGEYDHCREHEADRIGRQIRDAYEPLVNAAIMARAALADNALSQAQGGKGIAEPYYRTVDALLRSALKLAGVE